MTTAARLLPWVRLDEPPPRPATRRTRGRPKVPRQPTWTEGRWHDFFHGPDVFLPGQRLPTHDRVGPGTPALA